MSSHILKSQLPRILNHGQQRLMKGVISSSIPNTVISKISDSQPNKRYYSTTKPRSIISLLDDDFSIMYAPTDTTISLKKLESIDNAYELHDMIQEVLEEGNDSTKAYFYLSLKTQQESPIQKPLYGTYTQVIHSLCENKEEGSAQRAQSLLSNLKEKMKLNEVIYTQGEVINVHELYHKVMKAWMDTKEKFVPVRLMELYNDMTITPKNGFVGVKNDKTYELVLNAWSQSSIPNASHQSILILEDMEDPKVCHYKAALKAIWNDVYKKSLNSNYPPMKKASKGYFILLEMEQQYKETKENKPDLECYTLVLKSLAKCVSREYTPMMDFLRLKMESYMLSSETYEIVLQALANCSNENAPDVAHDVLNTFVQKYKNGDPNCVNLPSLCFRHVLQCYAKNVNEESGENAQIVLSTLEGLGFEVDVDMYGLLLECYTKHPSVQKRLYKANYYLELILDSKASIETYNSYLHLKSTCNTTPLQNRATLLSSIQTLKKLEDRNIAPNSQTFYYLFQACQSLLPQDEQRTRIIQDVFSLCCKYQVVTDEILEMYKDAISLNVYRSMLDYEKDVLVGSDKDYMGWVGEEKVEQRLLRGGRL